MRQLKLSGKIEGMMGRFTLRPVKQEDFIFCERRYFENMGWIIETFDCGFRSMSPTIPE